MSETADAISVEIFIGMWDDIVENILSQNVDTVKTMILDDLGNPKPFTECGELDISAFVKKVQ